MSILLTGKIVTFVSAIVAEPLAISTIGFVLLAADLIWSMGADRQNRSRCRYTTILSIALVVVIE